ncbi:MAG: T9SS type A sorting domain-containing protein [Gemmatimonadota bacterium]|nr:T9SS type A sorting domain-containing protein [Gemmatimonadota bacterium]
MKATIGYLIGLVFVISSSAEPLLEGRVRLDSGEPVADAQVRLFDLTDLRQGAIVRAMTDGTGYFALPLAALTGRTLPEQFALGPNYPNPFNPSTIIPYQLAASSAVRLEVFNLLGQHIATLVDGERPAGFHTATWHATDATGRAVGAGVYIYRMTVGVESQTGRMVLLDGQAGLSAVGTASVMPGMFGVGGSDGDGGQVYGLIVSGSGLTPYVDSSFWVESGMAPVELVVSSGFHSAGKATDDDFLDLFGAFNDQAEEEADEAEEEAEDATEEEEDETGEGDLIVYASISKTNLMTGQAFTLRARVQNQGTDEAQQLVLSYYRSSNATISTQDTLLGTDEVGSLAASSTSRNESISLTTPFTPGTYYYGACVTSASGASDTPNSCSAGVRVIVEGRGTPDLIVSHTSASHSSVTLGGRFSLLVEIENIGTGPAAETGMRYYRSDDATIDATDTRIWAFSTPRLNASKIHIHSMTWPISDEAGTYYVGVCVDPVPGETNIDNNCSIGVRVIVEDRGSPDLIVRFPDVRERSRTTRDFDIRATVSNIGSGMSAATTLRYYRSDDATIDATDTQVSTNGVENIATELYWEHYPHVLVAPVSPGTYYYGACVDPVPGESDTNNNCSEAVPINVGVPDLAIGLAWASTSVPLTGQSFTLTATVRNQGPNKAASTTLRYYRSDDATIDATDTRVASDAVSSLTGFDGVIGVPAGRRSGTSREAISVSAPSSPGTYYYGVCADPVPGEANTENNCSTGIYVRVVSSGKDPFNIELVFLGDFSDKYKDLMQQAARRWETIITEGLPDVNFSANPHSYTGFTGETIVVNDMVDDLRISVERDELYSPDGGGVVGMGGPSYTRSGNPIGLPALGMVVIDTSFGDGNVFKSDRLLEHIRRDVMIHEIAHVLGFGSLWAASGLLHESSRDAYFNGELAIKAFNAAGGENYSGNKVPISFLGGSCFMDGHWDPYAFRGLDREFGTEAMEPTLERGQALSAITIQSLADLGYVVDVSRADPYRLPASISTYQPPPASAKPVASHDFDLGNPGAIYVGDEQGRIIRTLGD